MGKATGHFALLLALAAAHAAAQSPPTWGAESNPSPTANSGVSRNANAAADRAQYKDIVYSNASRTGPQLIVIPGEIKSNNVTFTQKYGANNIADFAELELTKANFQVLDRADLGPMLNEIELAYGAGDPDQARKIMQKGRLKTTKWIVRFDVLKVEEIAQQRKKFNGGVASSLIGLFGNGSQTSNAAGTVAGSLDTGAAASVWLVGMRYKILDANTTEQIAQGYNEEKMESGASSTSVAGVSQASAGGVSLDTLVQRLVQKSVWEIDNKYK
jgi:hypothetical protein